MPSLAQIPEAPAGSWEPCRARGTCKHSRWTRGDARREAANTINQIFFRCKATLLVVSRRGRSRTAAAELLWSWQSMKPRGSRRLRAPAQSHPPFWGLQCPCTKQSTVKREIPKKGLTVLSGTSTSVKQTCCYSVHLLITGISTAKKTKNTTH